MRTVIKRTPLAFLVVLSLWLLPCTSGAVLVVKTDVVSGKIVQIYANRSIRLDNGVIYLPSRKGLSVNLAPGETVTLRYMIENTGEKKFFEYAPGVGSLAPLPPYSPKAEDKRDK